MLVSWLLPMASSILFFWLILLGSTGLGRDVMAAAQPPQKKTKSSQAESCELAMPKRTLDQLTEALMHALQRNMAGEVPAPAPVNKGSLPLPQPKARPVQVGHSPSTNPNLDRFKYQDVSAENRRKRDARNAKEIRRKQRRAAERAL